MTRAVPFVRALVALALVTLALVTLALGVTAAPAQAGILSQEDATDLAQSLADAQEEQEVCYGWEIANNFDGVPDVGSSIGGPGARLIALAGSCPRGVVVLEGSIDYSCASCEAEDSASVSIRSSGMASPPTAGDLERLGLKASALTGDKDDTTLVNMVNALPLLVADRGNAPYVAYEPAEAVPASDHATGKPGSDFLRDNWFSLVLSVMLIAFGPVYYLYKRAQHPQSSKASAQKPAPTKPAT